MGIVHAPSTPCKVTIPSDYVLDRLDQLGPRLLQSLDASRDLLYDSLQGSITAYDIDFPPSHILAIHTPNKNAKSSFFLQPVHDIILYSQCSKLPPIPAKYRLSCESPTFTAAPITIPHPSSFDIVHRYLYTHNIDDIIRYLLASSGRRIVRRCSASGILSRHVETLILVAKEQEPTTYQQSITELQHAIASCSVTHQRRLISRLNGLLANCRALGIHEPRLYTTLQLVSLILRNALRLGVYQLRQRHRAVAHAIV